MYGVTEKAHGVLPMAWATAPATRPAPITEVAAEDVSTPPAPEPQAPEPPIATKPEEEAPPPKAKLPPAELVLERCAAIRASIALREAEKAGILAAQGLDAAVWAALEQRWNDAVQEETEGGGRVLLDAYDAAYVAQIEAERGPLTAEKHARLLGNAGRGRGEVAIVGVALPDEGLLRIKRVGLRRMSADPEFAAGLARALAKGKG